MTRSNNCRAGRNSLTRFELNKTLQMTRSLLTNLNTENYVGALPVADCSSKIMKLIISKIVAGKTPVA